MEIIDSIARMKERSDELIRCGKSIAFVPTMGFLHDGHLELMRIGRKQANVLVISIFVNPTQFGPAEDFGEYPRDMEGDLSKAKRVGVDFVFIPSLEEMYPDGFQTHVAVEKITKYLCGISRPGHFQGVTTVVSKLFHIIKPHLAIFGQKDFQQLTVIKRMVKDLNMDIEVIGIPTVRESDGLAMSSRNHYLSPEQRRSALSLKKSLDMAHHMCSQGEKDATKIKKAMEKLILSFPFTEIDYVAICDPITMEDIDTLEEQSLVALAVRVGKTRLIDNALIGASIRN